MAILFENLDTFQFSPLREGRPTSSSSQISEAGYFNSRPCERGDQISEAAKTARSIFQFSPLREGRPYSELKLAQSQYISILAPARGATYMEGWKMEKGVYFNSRPCERGDISGRCSFPCAPHFNSRPCERGDGGAVFTIPLTWYFNSRPCERGDATGVQSCALHTISILAPARGATLSFRIALPAFVFQFSPLREGRPMTPSALMRSCRKFQFSPLREGRQVCKGALLCNSYFNSRPCERGDFSPFVAPAQLPISILAPARGATSGIFLLLLPGPISILAPARGATRCG